MTAHFAIKVFFGLMASVLLIWGFMNESKVAAFERAFVKAVKLTIAERRSLKAARIPTNPGTEKIMHKTAELTYNEKERRANAAAYARRQAAKLNESNTDKAERYLAEFDRTSRVA